MGNNIRKVPLSEGAMAILTGRGLDPELIVQLGVQSLDRSEGDWIAIPFIAGGQVVNNKYRSLSGEKRFQQDASARKCFWNLDCLSDRSLAEMPLIITEGEFDAMIALQCGYLRTVSVPDGAPAAQVGDQENSTKYSYLDDAAAQLASIKEIILCTDGDQPGINLMNDLALRLGKGRCKWVKYPKGCKDLNETFVKYGDRGIMETLARAQWCKLDGVYRMSELAPVAERKAHNIGIPGLAEHYNIRPMDFCVVTGIPSHGKTAFINDVCCNMVAKHGWTVAIASFEQQPQVDHRRNLRTWHAGKRVKDMSGDEIKAADAWIDKHFCFIVPSEDDEVSLDWALARCKDAILRYGCKLVVLDPWNEMDHIRPSDMSLTEYTGFAIKQIKRLAMKYAVHVIVAAHPSKPAREPSDKVRIPNLHDISDSAHWYNKADVGIIVHRDNEKKTTIRIAKSRYHDQIGKPGDYLCTFDPSCNRFSPIRSEVKASVPYADND